MWKAQVLFLDANYTYANKYKFHNKRIFFKKSTWSIPEYWFHLAKPNDHPMEPSTQTKLIVLKITLHNIKFYRFMYFHWRVLDPLMIEPCLFSLTLEKVDWRNNKKRNSGYMKTHKASLFVWYFALNCYKNMIKHLIIMKYIILWTFMT